MIARVLLTILVLMFSVEAEARGFVVYGWGTESCGAWTKYQAEREPIGADGNMRCWLKGGAPNAVASSLRSITTKALHRT